jgi:hypothetical protein
MAEERAPIPVLEDEEDEAEMGPPPWLQAGADEDDASSQLSKATAYVASLRERTLWHRARVMCGALRKLASHNRHPRLALMAIEVEESLQQSRRLWAELCAEAARLSVLQEYADRIDDQQRAAEETDGRKHARRA